MEEKNKERFVETYSQGIANIRKIIVDRETGSTTCCSPPT